MKKIFLSIIFSVSLFGASMFTLENVNNLKLYIDNSSDLINIEQINHIKKITEQKLKSAGIELNKVDASTFMIKIETIEIEESYAALVSIGLGEEVTTKRKDKIQTFSWTYYTTDFMELDEPYKNILESVNYLVDEFIEGYEDDKE